MEFLQALTIFFLIISNFGDILNKIYFSSDYNLAAVASIKIYIYIKENLKCNFKTNIIMISNYQIGFSRDLNNKKKSQ